MPNLTVLSATTNSLDLFDTVFAEEDKPGVPLVFKEDPVALAFASYRIWKTTGARWSELETCSATNEDHAQAEQFRKYYRGRLTWSILKGQGKAPSSFRRKLYELVNGTLVITKGELGMLHRLPYFYEEDQAMDEVVAVTTTVDKPTRHSAVHTFRLLKRILKSRRAGDFHQFWLTAENSQQAFLLTVKGDNPLLSLVESIVQQPSFSLSAEVFPKYYMGYHRDKVYNHLALPKLV